MFGSPSDQYAESTQCSSCPAARYSSSSGWTTCKACSGGWYGTQTGQTGCKKCPAGQFSSSGQTGCTACPAGKYQSSGGSSSCASCPVDTYAPSSGRTSACITCGGDGTTNGETGQASCTPGTPAAPTITCNTVSGSAQGTIDVGITPPDENGVSIKAMKVTVALVGSTTTTYTATTDDNWDRLANVYCSLSQTNVLQEFDMADGTVTAAQDALARCESFCSASIDCNACSVDCWNGPDVCRWAAIPSCGEERPWNGKIVGDISLKQNTECASPESYDTTNPKYTGTECFGLVHQEAGDSSVTACAQAACAAGMPLYQWQALPGPGCWAGTSQDCRANSSWVGGYIPINSVSITVPQLSADALNLQYTATVVATNANGDSLASTASASCSFDAVPGVAPNTGVAQYVMDQQLKAHNEALVGIVELGSFVDSGSGYGPGSGRAMSVVIEGGAGAYTVQSCMAACHGYTYVGLQDGGQCFCSNSWVNTTRYGAFSADCYPLGKAWCNAIYARKSALPAGQAALANRTAAEATLENLLGVMEKVSTTLSDPNQRLMVSKMTLSSVFSADYPASNCNDGILDNSCDSACDDAVISDGKQPWLEMDLGAARAVSSVKIWNREDCCQERVGAHVLELSNDGSAWTMCFDGSLPASYGPFNEACVGIARYVRLRMTHAACLNLAEVQVFGSFAESTQALLASATLTLHNLRNGLDIFGRQHNFVAPTAWTSYKEWTDDRVRALKNSAWKEQLNLAVDGLQADELGTHVTASIAHLGQLKQDRGVERQQLVDATTLLQALSAQYTKNKMKVQDDFMQISTQLPGFMAKDKAQITTLKQEIKSEQDYDKTMRWLHIIEDVAVAAVSIAMAISSGGSSLVAEFGEFGDAVSDFEGASGLWDDAKTAYEVAKDGYDICKTVYDTGKTILDDIHQARSDWVPAGGTYNDPKIIAWTYQVNNLTQRVQDINSLLQLAEIVNTVDNRISACTENGPSCKDSLAATLPSLALLNQDAGSLKYAGEKFITDFKGSPQGTQVQLDVTSYVDAIHTQIDTIKAWFHAHSQAQYAQTVYDIGAQRVDAATTALAAAQAQEVDQRDALKAAQAAFRHNQTEMWSQALGAWAMEKRQYRFSQPKEIDYSPEVFTTYTDTGLAKLTAEREIIENKAMTVTTTSFPDNEWHSTWERVDFVRTNSTEAAFDRLLQNGSATFVVPMPGNESTAAYNVRFANVRAYLVGAKTQIPQMTLNLTQLGRTGIYDQNFQRHDYVFTSTTFQYKYDQYFQPRSNEIVSDHSVQWSPYGPWEVRIAMDDNPFFNLDMLAGVEKVVFVFNLKRPTPKQDRLFTAFGYEGLTSGFGKDPVAEPEDPSQSSIEAAQTSCEHHYVEMVDEASVL
eukprot:g4710.t1